MLFGVIVLILLGATNYDNALAYLLCFLLLGLSFSTMLRTWRNLAGLTLETLEAPAVHAGDTARFPLLLGSTDARTRLAYHLRRLEPRRRWWWWRPRVLGELDCPGPLGGEVALTFDVPTTQRGWLTLGRIELSSLYPLGLFRTWGYFRPVARCLVYPRPAGRLPLPGSGVGTVQGGGSNGPGQDDFAGLRAYRPGDSPRHVHWRASARSESLLVKQLEGGGHGELCLRWRDTEILGDREARIAQLTAWVLLAERESLRYGLELTGAQFAAGSGAGHQAQLLRALALLPA